MNNQHTQGGPLNGYWIKHRSSHRLAAVRLAIGMAAILCGSAAHAATATCSGTGGAATFALPARISVPRDAAVGTNLTGWIKITDPTLFTCSTSQPAQGGWTSVGGQAKYMGSEPAPTMTIAAPAGTLTAPVYKTNVTGVGLAVSASVSTSPIGGCNWAPWGFGGTPPFLSRFGCATTSSWTNQPIGAAVAVALVKLSDPVSSGTVQASSVAEFYPAGGDTYLDPAIGNWSRKTYSISSIQIVSLTCTTPNVTVDLGPVRQSAFKGVGTTAGKKSFAIKLNNCPSGINTVSYRIDPSTSILDAKNSVIALNPKGATGVGVQLMDSSGKPLPLQTAIKTGYAPNAASFSIPLQAAYYQTSTTITPGPANSGATFTMNYQ